MKKLINTICVLAVFSVFHSCDIATVKVDPTELPTITSAVDEVVVEADAALVVTPKSNPDDIIEQNVVDTLNITSSRSWTVSVVTEDGGDWLAPVMTERINVSGMKETYPLAIKYARYRGDVDRKATLTFKCVGVDEPLVIPVTQKAYVPSLELQPLSDISGIPAISGKLKVLVRCNSSWSAGIHSSSDVQPEIDFEDGTDSQIITLNFPNNFNNELARTARLVVNANGCDSRTLEIYQRQCDDFWSIDTDVKELSPLDESYMIPFKANGAWTAHIEGCTFENAKLDPESGYGCMDGVKFIADHGFDPTVALKTAKIVFHSDEDPSRPDLAIELRQQGSIHLNFGHFNPEYTGKKTPTDTYKPYTQLEVPFSSPAKFPTTRDVTQQSPSYAGQVTDCVMKNGGWVFTMFGSTSGIWYNNSGQLWLVGSSANDYILFPSVPGYRLAKMYYEASCREFVNYTVRNEDGSEIIAGGEQTSTVTSENITSEYNDLHVHTFPNTEAGARYRLNRENAGVISVKDLCLVYEEVK